MYSLQKQIEQDAAYLQLLFQKGKHSKEISARYLAALELLFLLDLDFRNPENAIKN